MVGLFKANNAFNVFLLFIYGLLLKLAWLLHPAIPGLQKNDGFLFKKLLLKLQYTGAQLPIVYFIITYVLLFTQAITLNKIVSDQKLMQRTNYLPAMSYLLITSMFKEWNVLSAALIINTLMLFAWSRLSDIYGNSKPKTLLFNIGLIIGLCSFFYFPSLVFGLLIVYVLVVSRPFILAEWVIALMGIITPYYFLFAYLFLTDRLNTYKIAYLKISYPHLQHNPWEFSAIVLAILTFFIGFFVVQANFRKQLVQIRKKWSLALLYFVIAIFIPFINAVPSLLYWLLAAIPLSAYIAGAFLYPSKRWLPFLLHWIMAAIVVMISFQ